MKHFLRFITSLKSTAQVKRFYQATKNPMASQTQYLLDLLRRNKDTVYGQKYGFEHVKNVEDYQSQLPVVTFDDIRFYAEEMALGKKKILTAEEPYIFKMTRGTTGDPKYIPSTPTARMQKAKVLSLWMHHVLSDHPEIISGKILSIANPEIEGVTPGGIPFGEDSGYTYQHAPNILRSKMCLPQDVFDIDDYDACYYAILRLSIEQNVTMISTVNPSTIVLLAQFANRYSQIMINDIKNGTLDHKFHIDKDIRGTIERNLHPNPKRAQELQELFDANQKTLYPKHYWKNLSLISCWKGGTVGLYLKNFSKFINPHIPVRDMGYLAAELCGSIPLHDQGKEGVLAIETNFFEFIRESEISYPNKTYLTCDQLQQGERYYVYVTNDNGLYRYGMDDLILVTGFYQKTPMIEFIQKGLGVTSITGDKLQESHVLTAVDRAVNATRLSVEFFATTIEKDEQNASHYTFLVEFQDEPNFQQKYRFLKGIDAELSGLNIEYERKRKSKLLQHPYLKVIKPGGFKAFQNKQSFGGVHDGQFKSCGLTSQEDFAKHFEIIEIIKIDS